MLFSLPFSPCAWQRFCFVAFDSVDAVNTILRIAQEARDSGEKVRQRMAVCVLCLCVGAWRARLNGFIRVGKSNDEKASRMGHRYIPVC